MWEYILEDCLNEDKEEVSLTEIKNRVLFVYQVDSTKELKKDSTFLEAKREYNLDMRFRESWLKLLYEI